MDNTIRSLALVGLALPCLAYGQWQQVPLPTTNTVFCLDSYDAQNLCAGTSGNWLRSSDGGNTWTLQPLMDPLGFQLITLAFYDMAYRSPTELLGTGLFFVNDHPFEIRRSTNAGATWASVFSGPGNGQFTSFNAMAFSGSNGIAVGDFEVIARTTNGGATWSAANTGTSALRAAAWANATTAIAVGDGIIRRSTNSGQTWTTVWSGNGTLRAVSFPSATVGFAAGSGGDLLRSTDGGATWTPLGANLPDGFPVFNSLWFASTTEGYAAANDRILRTTNGGLHWSWYQAPHPLRQLHFQSPTNGFAVGDNGLLMRTAPGAYRPYALFGSTGTVCHNVPVSFIDQSGPGLTRQWLVNGTPVGTDPVLEYTFTEPSQTYQVTLVVDNGTHTDTLTRSVVVGPSLAIQNEATILTETVCSGQGSTVRVFNSQPLTSYRLWRGAAPQGNAQNGTGNTLNFPTGTITADQVFHMVATRNLGNCGTSVDTASFLLAIGNPLPTLTVTPGAVTQCVGDTIVITVEGSQLNVNYQLRRNNVNVGAPQAGTGGSLSYVVGPLTASGTYTLFATNTQNNCTSTLQQTVPVTLEIPQLSWGADAMNPLVGTPVHLMNGSNVLGGTYAWTIPSGTPATSTSAEVEGVVFNAPGSFPVKLRGITPIGCRDSLVQVLHVVEQPAPQECAVSQLSVRGTNPRNAAIAMGADGALFGWLHATNPTALIAYSGAGDTLFVPLPGEPNYQQNSLLMKFDRHGIPQWRVRFWHNATGARHGDVAVDELGNVYTAYFHNEFSDSLRIVDASGARTTIDPPHSGSFLRSMVITSFTAQGRLRWIRTFLDTYTNEVVRVRLDGLGHVWVQGTDRLVKYDRDSGTLLFQLALTAGFRDITITPNDHVWVTERFNMVLREYSNAGALLQTTPAITPTPPPFGLTRLNGWEAACDPAGNIYQLHNIQGQAIIGNDTLTGPGTNSSNQYYVYFIAKRGPGGEVLWTRSFEMDGQIVPQGIAVNGERVFVSVRFTSSDTLRMQGLDPMPFHAQDSWLLSYDLNGAGPAAQRVHEQANPPATVIPVPGTNALVLSPDGQRMALWVGFLDPLAVAGDTAFSHVWTPPPSNGSKDHGLVFGTIDCLMPGLPASENVPQASFTAPEGNCINQPLQFVDASLFNPTAWSWSFPGGVPATSTEASPVVSYTLPGSYPVTLVASNAFGPSAPYTTEVFVDICTALPSVGADAGWRVWPVPTMDQLNVRGPAPAAGRVVDMQGREVWRGTVPAEGTIDLGGLPPGAYLLQVDGARLRILKQ